MSATAAFAWLVAATGMGFVLSGLGAAVVLLLREPARRVRAIELTLLACLVAPWLPAVPGLPRVAWREWLAAPDGAESEIRETASALSEPAEPIAASAVPESTERASSAPIIELAVDPEPSAAPPLDLTVDREPLPAAEPAVLAPIERAEIATVVTATAAEPVAPSPPSPAVELSAARQVDWQAVVVTLYFAGVAAIVLLDALGGLALLRVWKSSRGADPRVQALLSDVAGQSAGRVSLLVSPRCRQPFTFAWLWPVIVLPPALVVPGKERELRWALAHEWSHVAHRHTWGWALAGLARAIYWPQPLVWLLRRRLRLEQDFLADAQAAGRASEAPDYATFLTTQAATAHGLTPGLGIAGGKSELARRVVMLVQGKRPVAATCGWKCNVGLAVVTALAMMGAASLAGAPQRTANRQTPAADQRGEVAGEQAQDSTQSATAADAPKSGQSAEGGEPTGVTSGPVIEPFDLLQIHVVGLPPPKAPVEGMAQTERRFGGAVDREGQVSLGARFGRFPVAGLTVVDAEAKILDHLKKIIREDVEAERRSESNSPVTLQVVVGGRARSMRIWEGSAQVVRLIRAGDGLQVNTTGAAVLSPNDRFQVEPQGTLALGPELGRVEVKGLTREAAADRILARIREAIPKYRPGVQNAIRANATVSVTFPDSPQPASSTKLVPLPEPGYRIVPGNWIGIEALGPNLEPRLLGAATVDSDGNLSLRRSGDRYVHQAGDRLWAVGIDAELPAAGLTEKELEAEVRRELEKTGPVPWLQVKLGSFDARLPDSRHEPQGNQPAKGTIAPGQRLKIAAVGMLPDQPIDGEFVVEPEGTVMLGPQYGRVLVSGLTLIEAEQHIERDLSRLVSEPRVSVSLVDQRPNLRYAGKSFDQWNEELQNDLDPETRIQAIAALGQFGANGLTDQAIAALVPLLGNETTTPDGKQIVGRVAGETLASFGKAVVPALIETLKGADEKARLGAAWALGRLGDDAAPAAEALVAAAAASERKYDFVGAIAAIRTRPEVTLPYLKEAALSPQGGVRWASLRGLGGLKLADGEIVPLIVESLETWPPADAHMIALGQMMKWNSSAQNVAVLRELLKGAKGKDLQQRNTLILAVKELGPAGAPLISDAIELVKATSPQEQQQEVQLLQQVLLAIGPSAKDALPALRQWRDELGDEPLERFLAQQIERIIDDVLRSLGEAPVTPTGRRGRAAPRQSSEQEAAASRQYAGKSFTQWRGVLDRDLDPATRVEAIAAIGEFGANGQADEAIRVLIPLLGSQARSDKQGVATAAQQALSKIGAPAVPALIECLTNGDGATQLKATDAFIYMGEAAAPAADALLDLAKAKAAEPDWQLPLVRAIAGIQSRPEATLPFLKAMASSPNQDVRVAAIHGLSGLKTSDEEVVPLVVNAIWSYSGLQGRSNFFQHLPIGGGRTAAVLRGLLERAKKDVSSDGMVQVLFIRAGEMGPAAAPLVPLMIEVSQHEPNWQGAAIYLVQALERIGPDAKEALPYLRGMRDGQTDPGLRKLVNAAINAIEDSQ